MKVEEFFSEGFRLAKTEYWTIFFNIIIYILLIIIASITVIGLLIVPSLAVGLVRFTIRAGRGEEVDVGDSISWGFKDGMWLKSLIFCVVAIIGILIGFLLLIIPGFATDIFGFLLIFPLSRKFILGKFLKKFSHKENKKNNFIDGEFEDIDDHDVR